VPKLKPLQNPFSALLLFVTAGASRASATFLWPAASHYQPLFWHPLHHVARPA